MAEPKQFDFDGDIFLPTNRKDEFGYTIYRNKEGHWLHQSLHDKIAWRAKQIRATTKRRRLKLR
jgi:hypothetical protein